MAKRVVTLRVVIDPAFYEAIERATSAFAHLREVLEREDMVKVLADA